MGAWSQESSGGTTLKGKGYEVVKVRVYYP